MLLYNFRLFALWSIILFCPELGSGFNIFGTIEGGLYNQGHTLVCAYSEIPDSLTISPYNSLLYYGIGNFYLFEVPEGDYIILAFQDLNGNNSPDPEDYIGYYGGLPPEVIHLTGNLTGINITLSSQPTGYISGNISYSGQSNGPTFVEAYDNCELLGEPVGFGILRLEESQQIVFSLNGNGCYQNQMPEGTFYLRAFMDLDFSFIYNEGEPYGEYRDINGFIPIIIEEGEQISGVDFEMNDYATITLPNDYWENIPTEFSIKDVFPNPFNLSTMVRVGLPHMSELQICVYNILGKQIAVIAEGQYTKGYHNFTFNADHLSSGVYFIMTTVPTNINDHRKVLLLR